MQTGCSKPWDGKGTAEEPREIGRFAFGIKILRHPDGNLEYQTQSVNQGVPIEIVVMQLKALVNNLEKDYFDEFEKGTK